ncbi:MAG: hypothetical protein KME54_00025 [Tolypothrix brevis GSE-NOS-MK-07-07A]|jgi:cell division protein FtsB|nr:hypothetical protein [Tolypothrix brevis GSE-NOS-MK-07-07A]
MDNITQEKLQKLQTEVEFLFQQMLNLKNQQVEITKQALSADRMTQRDRIKHNCRIG